MGLFHSYDIVPAQGVKETPTGNKQRSYKNRAITGHNTHRHHKDIDFTLALSSESTRALPPLAQRAPGQQEASSLSSESTTRQQEAWHSLSSEITRADRKLPPLAQRAPGQQEASSLSSESTRATGSFLP